MKKKILFLLTMVFIFPFALHASSFKPALNCPESANPGETISCKITATVDNITAIQATYNLGSTTYDSFEFDSKIKDSTLTTSSSSTAFTIQENENAGSISTLLSSTSITIGTLKIKIPTSGNGPFYISIDFRGTDVTTYATVGKTTLTSTIKTKSVESTLKSLTVDGMSLSPSFSPNTTNYTLPQTDATFIKVSATASDTSAKVTGTGTISLKVGLNTIAVKVSSASGSVTTYTIKVTRTDERDTVNTLKSLSIKGYSITPSFKSSTKTYSLDVDSSVSKVTVEATLESSKSSFVKNYGPRTQNLNYGKNTITIKVAAENGTENSYSITVNRKDDRDKNNNLSSLSLSEGNIKFDKNTLKYTVDLDSSISEITISAAAESKKAQLSGTGTKKLSEGTNTFTITVTAENESVKKYVIVVNRGAASVVTPEKNETHEENETEAKDEKFITTLSINNADIDFNPDVYKYNIKLKPSEKTLDLRYKTGSGYTATVEGNENLKDGSVVKIIVEGKGRTIEYIFNIKEEVIEEESKSNDIILYIAIGLLSLVVVGIVISLLTKEKPTPEQVVKNKFFQEPTQKFYTSSTLVEGVKRSQVSGSMISQFEKPNSLTDAAPSEPVHKEMPKQEVAHFEEIDFDPITDKDVNNQNF